MVQFFKNSFRELKHVVWPTKEETKGFFIVVLAILILFWLYLTLANTVFEQWLLFLKDLV